MTVAEDAALMQCLTGITISSRPIDRQFLFKIIKSVRNYWLAVAYDRPRAKEWWQKLGVKCRTL